MAGAASVTLLNPNLPAHSHSVNCDNTGAGSTAPSGQIPGISNDRTTSLAIYSGAKPNATMSPAMCGNTGNNVPFANTDPFLGINFIICTQGIFPSRN